MKNLILAFLLILTGRMSGQTPEAEVLAANAQIDAHHQTMGMTNRFC